VPTAVESAIVAPVGLNRKTLNVSFDSAIVSPRTLTVMVLVVWPGAMVAKVLLISM
jgi:hypothetical protein